MDILFGKNNEKYEGRIDKLDYTNSEEKNTQGSSNMTHKDTVDNKKLPTIEGVHSQKIGGMWNHKNEITSYKLYELILTNYLKG